MIVSLGDELKKVDGNPSDDEYLYEQVTIRHNIEEAIVH